MFHVTLIRAGVRCAYPVPIATPDTSWDAQTLVWERKKEEEQEEKIKIKVLKV